LVRRMDWAAGDIDLAKRRDIAWHEYGDREPSSIIGPRPLVRVVTGRSPQRTRRQIIPPCRTAGVVELLIEKFHDVKEGCVVAPHLFMLRRCPAARTGAWDSSLGQIDVSDGGVLPGLQRLGVRRRC